MKFDTRGMEPDEIAALQEKNSTQEPPTRMAGEALAKPKNDKKSIGYAAGHAFSDSDQFFGHEDYEQSKKKGYSDSEIKDYLDQNSHLLRMKNEKGKGGLYDQISNNVYGDDSKTSVKKSSSSTSSTPGGWAQPGSVDHVKPDTPLSDYTVNNYKEGQFPGDSNLGGKEWSDYWKGANQSGRSEDYNQYGKNRAAESIASGKENQSVDKSALQGRMDARESYYMDKAKLSELNLYGDVDRAMTTDWQQPDALAPVEKPDLDPQKYLDQILDIKLDSGKSEKKKDSDKDKNSNTNTLAAVGVGGLAGGLIAKTL